jgi:hypothetical protein
VLEQVARELLADGVGDGVATGVIVAPTVGVTEDGVSTSGRRSASKSGLLITKVPSRSSVCANHFPSPADAPTTSL